jgi:hypothetical protein
MTPTIAEVDGMGSVGFVLMEFPVGRCTFSGELAEELSLLANEGLIRILDLLVIQKAADGSVDAFEVDDLDTHELCGLEEDVPGILAAEDVSVLSRAMAPASVAGVVVWAYMWAAPFEAAARRTGARYLAAGRLLVEVPLDPVAENPCPREERSSPENNRAGRAPVLSGRLSPNVHRR